MPVAELVSRSARPNQNRNRNEREKKQESAHQYEKGPRLALSRPIIARDENKTRSTETPKGCSYEFPFISHIIHNYMHLL